MLLSMTGFGEARCENADLGIALEIKSVNNRHLKVSTRIPEAMTALEGEIERVIRKAVVRGTVHVTVRCSRNRDASGLRINADALKAYHDQLIQFSQATGLHPPQDAGPLLSLPGVISEADDQRDPETLWTDVSVALNEALGRHYEFRKVEGQAMADELLANQQLIADRLSKIAEEAPKVVADYRDRLLQRVRQMLEQTDVELQANDVIREVSLFADRCDITEEITRLKSHLQQFEGIMAEEKSQGRRLEFIGQEMFREVNTIGSKANSVTIAHNVVEMKAAIEKMREILQNVE